VSYRQKTVLLVQYACLALSMALAGCSRTGDSTQTPAAAINGKNAPPEKGGIQGDSSQKPASDPKHPVVVIETSLGNMTVRLDGEKTPLTVDNFLSYVSAGHYDQTIVHQVFKGQGFLGGGYGTNLVEKPGRTPIRNEAHNGAKNLRGTIAMARLPDAIDSATCQFFVNVADNPALDFKARTPEGYGYCVFGEVVEGMDVIDKIGEDKVSDTPEFERTPTPPIIVKSIRRVR
jgi:cyclophilin family peptidyl-prolyl cis-trans isomerase